MEFPVLCIANDEFKYKFKPIEITIKGEQVFLMKKKKDLFSDRLTKSRTYLYIIYHFRIYWMSFLYLEHKPDHPSIKLII